jgi:hypothetical protein
MVGMAIYRRVIPLTLAAVAAAPVPARIPLSPTYNVAIRMINGA